MSHPRLLWPLHHRLLGQYFAGRFTIEQLCERYQISTKQFYKWLSLWKTHNTISVADFYKQLCSILGVSDKGGKTGMFKVIQEQITYLYKKK